MQYILHRVNQISALKKVNPEWGVEIDLRSNVNSASALHLSHDAWVQGDSFLGWLEEFKRLGIKGPILLNTKEDGLEEELLKLMKRFEIEKFLFTDTSFPTLVRWVLEGKGTYFAARFSAYEPIEILKNLKGKVEWVWVDSFGGKPVSQHLIRELKADFKLCLVSPELHTKDIQHINAFKSLAGHMRAICTKSPDAWAELLKS